MSGSPLLPEKFLYIRFELNHNCTDLDGPPHGHHGGVSAEVGDVGAGVGLELDGEVVVVDVPGYVHLTEAEMRNILIPQ